jgi:hypothetical protein
MIRWCFPSFAGDFSLEADPEDKDRCILVVNDPTPAELTRLEEPLKAARSKKWISQTVGIQSEGTSRLVIAASLVEMGKVLAPNLMSKEGTLTAVKAADGKITASYDPVAVVTQEEAIDAVTVHRPTHCCPHNQPGPVDHRANLVLLRFLTPSQTKSWANDGSFVVFGHLSGHAYRVYHRHHPDAVRLGKCCLDIDEGHVLHLWNWMVPPAEECLALKLFLEHREPAVRNPSSCLSGRDRFRNPFGSQYADGTDSASFMDGFGDAIKGALAVLSGAA